MNVMEKVYDIAIKAGLSWSLNAFKAHATEKNVHYILHDYGFIALSIVLDEAEIINIAVLPEHQRQGVGCRLWEDALRYMDKRHVVQCFLEVRKSNQKAQCFYERCGFSKIGIRKNYYRHPKEDAWIYIWEKK